MATKKELFERIVNTMSTDEEVVAMCGKYIAQLEKANSRKSKPNEKTVTRAETILTWLQANYTEPLYNKDIAAGLKDAGIQEEDQDISGQKVAAAMRYLTTAGKVTAEFEVVEKGTPRKLYTLVK